MRAVALVGGRLTEVDVDEPALFQRLAANVVSTNTALATGTLVTVFTSPTLAAGTYEWDCEGYYVSAATTTGLVIGYGFTVAPASNLSGGRVENGAAVAANVGGSNATTMTPAAPYLIGGTASAGASTPLPFDLEGSFVLTAPAALVVVMRSEIGGSAATVLAGSRFTVSRKA